MDEKRQGIKPELVAMVAVISISSWHVGNYMSRIDGWVMASIMGAVLGFCNFLMAHNIFKPKSTSRGPSFVGLIFFALTSTWMQYTYFNTAPEMTATYIMHINVDALCMGIWAPAAEVLLGWVHAANSIETTHVVAPVSLITKTSNLVTVPVSRQNHENGSDNIRVSLKTVGQNDLHTMQNNQSQQRQDVPKA